MASLMYRVGIIGTGKMGGALIRAILDKSLICPENLFIYDKQKEKLDPFVRKGAQPSSIDEIGKKVDILIIAVKPGDVKDVLGPLKGTLSPSQMLVSVAAGVTISFLSKIIGNAIPVVRVMPNAAISVNEGACVLSAGCVKNPEKIEFVRKIFESVGYAVELSENKLDAVTGLSGSGPAYVYRVIQGLIQGGEKTGLPREIARKLAIQTVLGAAKLVKESDKELRELITFIATPGGTTVEGLKVLDNGKVVELFSQAVVAAAKRAGQISLEIESQNEDASL